MATFAQTIKKSKGLNQIAAQVKNVALFYAPKKTGRLKRALNSANRPDKMVKIKTSGKTTKITVSLDVAPTDAEYGKYWNDPDVSWQVEQGGNPKNIDFGKKAFIDKSVKNEIDKFAKEVGDDFLKMLKKQIKV